jgi:hypothetical protein
MIDAPDKSSLEKVVEDLAEADDPEGVMASQLLTAVVNRPLFVAEVRRWAFEAFADEKGERRSTDPYDRPICPDPNCPPTAIAPIDVPESSKRPVLSRNVPSQLMRLRCCSTVLCVTTLWDCPNTGCPPTENAPKELSVEQAVSHQPARRGQPAIMRIQDLVDFLKLPSAQTVHSWIKKGSECVRPAPPAVWTRGQQSLQVSRLGWSRIATTINTPAAIKAIPHHRNRPASRPTCSAMSVPPLSTNLRRRL